MNSELVLNMNQVKKIKISDLKTINTSSIDNYLKSKRHSQTIKKICNYLADDILKDQEDFETTAEITVIHDNLFISLWESYPFLKNTHLYTQSFGFDLNNDTNKDAIKKTLNLLIKELKICDLEVLEEKIA